MPADLLVGRDIDVTYDRRGVAGAVDRPAKVDAGAPGMVGILFRAEHAKVDVDGAEDFDKVFPVEDVGIQRVLVVVLEEEQVRADLHTGCGKLEYSR